MSGISKEKAEGRPAETKTVSSVTVKAYAKINMTLEVREERPDGYHGIETLFRGISLCDLLRLTKGEAGIRLICEGDCPPEVPRGRDNLAWKAAELLRRAFPGRIGGAQIRLTKRIPAAAGLGGGSADAAAVLLGLDRLYCLGLAAETLRRFAAELGSDVPFCLSPLAAVGRGRGETLEAAEPGPPFWMLLVKPPFGLSTAAVYEKWKKEENTEAAEKEKKENLRAVLAGMRGGRPEIFWGNMFNDLEGPAFALEKRLAGYRARIAEEVSAGSASLTRDPGDGRIMLCGSGTVLAVFFAREESARLLEERLRGSWAKKAETPLLFVTRTLDAADLDGRITQRE